MIPAACIRASGAVTRSLQIRARSETRPTQSYDQSVMIAWSRCHPIPFGDMHSSAFGFGLAVRARFVGTMLLAAALGAPLFAQQPSLPTAAPSTGRIVGRILDATTG